LYNPPWFRENDLGIIREEIGRIGFGTLVTVSSTGNILASHVPMLLDTTKGEQGQLRGHIARANLQWRDTKTGSEGLAIFLGPDAYITPRWYETKRQTGKVVPTWNYVAIHVRGPVTFFTDADWLKENVTSLTKKHEFGAETPWKIADAPSDYIGTELKAIVGFEMAISRMEGKWKMSQNRPERDRVGVVEGLSERNENQDLEVLENVRSRTEG